MNKLFKFSLLIVILLSGCSPTPKQASEYNNQLIRQQRKVISKMDDLINSFSNYNPQQMQQEYNLLIKVINQAIDSVKMAKPFDGSTEFRDKTLQLLNIYKSVTENEFKKVLQLLSKPESDYTAQDAQAVSDLMLEAQNKISKANEDYKKYQKQFAQKYNLNLIAN